jgi:PKD repeat protein
MLRVRQFLPLFLVLLVSSAAYAAALTLTSSSVDQLGMGEGNVDRYYVRVLLASITVNSNDFNNQITGVSVTLTSTVPGTYVVTITVTNGIDTRTFTTTTTLSTTSATITFTITPSLDYTAPGVTISVRADPA